MVVLTDSPMDSLTLVPKWYTCLKLILVNYLWINTVAWGEV